MLHRSYKKDKHQWDQGLQRENKLFPKASHRKISCRLNSVVCMNRLRKKESLMIINSLQKIAASEIQAPLSSKTWPKIWYGWDHLIFLMEKNTSYLTVLILMISSKVLWVFAICLLLYLLWLQIQRTLRKYSCFMIFRLVFMSWGSISMESLSI